jgi:hypothetical protein
LVQAHEPFGNDEQLAHFAFAWPAGPVQ